MAGASAGAARAARQPCIPCRRSFAARLGWRRRLARASRTAPLRRRRDVRACRRDVVSDSAIPAPATRLPFARLVRRSPRGLGRGARGHRRRAGARADAARAATASPATGSGTAGCRALQRCGRRLECTPSPPTTSAPSRALAAHGGILLLGLDAAVVEWEPVSGRISTTTPLPRSSGLAEPGVIVVTVNRRVRVLVPEDEVLRAW